MGFFSFAQAADCDVDTDGDVDRLDLRLIISARDTPASGPDDTRDSDGDGTITMLDARNCVKQCNLKGCTIVEPPPPTPTPTKDPGQPDVAAPTPAQKAVKDVSKPVVTASDQSATSVQKKKIVSGTEWRVKSGDTLYAIGRAVYPGDARKQARLRQDIMKLNPSVFADGANNMAVGVVLKLPGYVSSKTAPPKVVEKAKLPKPAPVAVTPKPAPVVVTPKPAAPAPVVKPEPEVQRKVSSATQGNVVASLGYAYGGDKLVYEDGSYDPAGAAAHGRLGYEQMYQNGGGYRIALGLQYGVADSATFKDIYLQVAYQYRADPFIYGIGVVFSEGAELEDDSTVEYDAANGAVVYLENVGSSDLAGWGLSYTSLDIDDKDTSESFDASRAELYYSWRF